MRKVLLICLLLVATPAFADLQITINQGVQGALPIAIVPFQAEQGANPPVNVAKVVSHDLADSGRFKPLADKNMLAQPHTAADINYRNWQTVNVDDVVVGRVKQTAAGGYQVTFQLMDVYRQSQVTGYTITVGKNGLRAAAHRVSDLIYEALTGKPGAFSTKIAYIKVTGSLHHKMYRLMVADQDGHDPHTLVRQHAPLLSPTWSPDGKKIAYVSLADNRSAIYVQDVETGAVVKVASKPGLNSAPAWSPNGHKLALSLSMSGHPNIYILNLSNGDLTQVTNSSAIDTEPAWSPDGKSLIFTSDRGGSPQIYRIPVSGGAARRITFNGKSNQSAVFSPSGNSIAMVHQDDHGFRIATMNLNTGDMTIVSKGPLDESPSYAPNGDMLIYGTRNNAKGGALAEVAIGTNARVQLKEKTGVQEPSWSPFLH